MRLLLSVTSVLVCLVFLAGCPSSSTTPPKPSVLGKWATSTLPEGASTREAWTFLDSGEWQFSGPMKLAGQFLTAEIEGKKQILNLTGSGTWELNGDRLSLAMTQTNVPSLNSDPIEMKVVSLGEKKLVVQQQDGQSLTFFRVE